MKAFSRLLFVLLACRASVTLGSSDASKLAALPEEEECGLSLRQLRASQNNKNVLTEERGLPAFMALDSDNDTNSLDHLDPDISLGIFLASQGNYADVSSAAEEDLKASWNHGNAHHHHHSHHGGSTRTLYHQTSCSAAHAIVKTGFRPGHIGWCGGGIYFATSAGATGHKAVGLNSEHGCIIQAQVNLGRIKHMSPICTSRRQCHGMPVGWAIRCISRGTHHFSGYDSIQFNPGDGTEYMIWSSSRVVSMKVLR
eukprot:TRINITY_DN109556_c0_g1_i1.p1 TRINITY_DN109556_c0_g1~~TRINITY_DN109556_c0_g1_i1.p1  ORF type:complete len:255 (-),score=43.60 TRINITY_DN109556_c0_g1_i1:78-842(-)